MSKSNNFHFKRGPQIKQLLNLLQPLKGPMSNEKGLQIKKNLSNIINEKDLNKAGELMRLFRLHSLESFKKYSINFFQ